MTSTELRSILLSLLSAELGTYQLKGTISTAPAIVVRPDGQKIAGDYTVTGLECVIRPDCESTPEDTFGITRDFKIWQVFLIQYLGTSRTIDVSRVKILSRFPGAKAIAVPSVRNDSVQSQLSFRIPDLTDGITQVS